MIIGIVEYYGSGKGDKAFARLKPFVLITDGVASDLSEEDRKARYPNDGMIFWWHPPQMAQQGSIWIAEVKQFDKPTGPDHHLVVNDSVLAAVELIEPFVKTDLDLRRELSNGHVTIGRSPAVKFMLAHPARSDAWIGPFEVHSQESMSGARTVKVSELSTGFAPVHRIDASSRLAIKVGGVERQVVLPSKRLADPIAQFCAQGDAQVLVSLLTRVRKLQPESANAIQVVRAVFSQYCEAVARADLNPQDRQREEERHRVAEALLTEAELDRDEGLALVEGLLEVPRLKEAISQRTEELARAGAEAAARAFDPEIRLKEDRVAALDSEIHDREMSLEAIREDEAQLRQLVDNLLVDARTRASVLLGAYLGPGSKALEHHEQEPVDESTVPELEWFRSFDEFKSAATIQSWTRGFGDTPTQLAIASLAATGLVTVIGSRQDEFSGLLALLIAPYSSCEVHSATDIFGLKDLLNCPALPLARSSCAGQTLGDFLAAQQRAGRLSVVVVRGANLAPPESFWPELQRLARKQVSAGWVDRKGRVLHLHAVAPILFVLHLVDGEASFRITDAISRGIPTVDADVNLDGEIEKLDGVAERGKSLSVGDWKSFVQSIALPTAPVATVPELVASALTQMGSEEADARQLSKLAVGIGREVEFARVLEEGGAPPLVVDAARTRNAQVLASIYREKSDE